jgi:hypothetical protein
VHAARCACSVSEFACVHAAHCCYMRVLQSPAWPSKASADLGALVYVVCMTCSVHSATQELSVPRHADLRLECSVITS